MVEINRFLSDPNLAGQTELKTPLCTRHGFDWQLDLPSLEPQRKNLFGIKIISATVILEIPWQGIRKEPSFSLCMCTIQKVTQFHHQNHLRILISFLQFNRYCAIYSSYRDGETDGGAGDTIACP